MAWAILATALFFPPTGIVAIVYAAQVNPKAKAGDIAGALASARKAVIWCWISAGISALVAAVFILATFVSLSQFH